ncbi:hypothetical protein HDU77_002512 [Chytriomyces hyalinus]|nr:hypothetical protein HDU77_002512 [Chytriomyces hyalinus]
MNYEFDDAETETELAPWEMRCERVMTDPIPCRILVVSCSTQTQRLLAGMDGAAIRAALFAPNAQTARNSWACAPGTGAGGLLIEVSPGVLSIDLAPVELGVSHLDLIQKLFSCIQDARPSDAVVVLDRLSVPSNDSDLPALITTSAASNATKALLSDFPLLRPPHLLSGWSAAILTYCEANSIPAHGFLAQTSSSTVFSEAKVLERFSVSTAHSTLDGKLGSLWLSQKSNRDQSGQANPLFL